MINLNDIDMDVDYDSLCFLESHLMHEVKRRGKEVFVNEFSTKLESFKKEWSYRDFCFLLALLGYLDSNFSYDNSVRLDKYIVEPFEFDDFRDCFNSDEYLVNLYNNSLNSFKLRGFIYSEVGEAV